MGMLTFLTKQNFDNLINQKWHDFIINFENVFKGVQRSRYNLCTTKVSLGISLSNTGTILKFLNSCTSSSRNCNNWNLLLACISSSETKSNSSINCSRRKYSTGVRWLVSPDFPCKSIFSKIKLILWSYISN